MEPLIVTQLRNILYQRTMQLGNLNSIAIASILDAISSPIEVDGKTYSIDIVPDKGRKALIVYTDHPDVSFFQLNFSKLLPSHYAPAITEIYGGEATSPADFNITSGADDTVIINAAGSLASVRFRKLDPTSIHIKLRAVGDDCMAAALMTANSCKHNISAEHFLMHVRTEVTATLNKINHKFSGVLYFTAKIDLRGGLTSGKISIAISLGQYRRTTEYSWDEAVTA